jgi:spore coat protein A
MLGTNLFHDLPAGHSLMQDPGAPPPPGAPLTAATPYTDAVTESPRAGDVEVWRITNLTADTHPMHFHLVNAQLLSRQTFSGYAVTGGVGAATGLGTAKGPRPTEIGWKDTILMNPGEVTTIVMKFDLAPVPFAVPQSPRTGGFEYVWHCHILEHEEHDMMRPVVVRGSPPRLP